MKELERNNWRMEFFGSPFFGFHFGYDGKNDAKYILGKAMDGGRARPFER